MSTESLVPACCVNFILIISRCNLYKSSSFNECAKHNSSFHVKYENMKLSKSLLSAILIGIAVQTTVTSCKKDNQTDPKKKEAKGPKQQMPDGCPACGMG